MIKSRLENLHAFLREKDFSAIIVSKQQNVFYFSGFSGDDSILVITQNDNFLVTDSRYTEQAAKEAQGYTIVEQKDGLLPKVAETIKKSGAKRAAFEDNIAYADYAKLQKFLTPIEIAAANIDFLRLQKSEAEAALIEKACRIGDIAFAEILKFIRPGISEFSIAAKLEYIMRENGSSGASFSTIVASGVRGSLPHGEATDKLLNDGEFVTMDYGSVFGGYHSDMTRTVCVGKADEKQRAIYNIVRTAQQLGLDAVAAGASPRQVDAAARDYIKAAGYGDNFGHGLGHGVGLEIHEMPRLSSKAGDVPLKVGTIVTVEPGIYITGWGGVRIEDTVYLGAVDKKILTHSSKELIEVAN